MNRLQWNTYFLLLARLVASRSTCNSRHVGCVIVDPFSKAILSTGYNGAVSGHPHCSDQGPEYCARRNAGTLDAQKALTCAASHAEANAIAQAARNGVPLGASTCYVTLEPCPTCLRLLHRAGIDHVYYELPYDGPRIPLYDEYDPGDDCDGKWLTKITLRPEAVDQAIAALADQAQRRLEKTE